MSTSILDLKISRIVCSEILLLRSRNPHKSRCLCSVSRLSSWEEATTGRLENDYMITNLTSSGEVSRCVDVEVIP